MLVRTGVGAVEGNGTWLAQDLAAV